MADRAVVLVSHAEAQIKRLCSRAVRSSREARSVQRAVLQKC